MTVKWAFIGGGWHSRLRIAPAMKQANNAEMLGVWSTPYEDAIAFAKEFEIERCYRTIEETVADTDIDAVFIATPNSLHGAHSIQAAKAGKHVLVEKPFTLTVAEAEEVVETAKKAGVLLGVGFHLRHHLLHQEAKRLVDAGEIGEIVYATGQYTLFTFTPDPRYRTPWKRDPALSGGAGSLYGMGVHVIDLMHYFTGQRPVEVTAMNNSDPETRLGENLTLALVHYDGGAFAHITSSSRFPFGKNDLTLYGTKGRIIGMGSINMPAVGRLEVTRRSEAPEVAASLTERPHFIKRLIQDLVADVAGVTTTLIESPLPDAYVCEIEAFGRAIQEGEEFHADGMDGLRSVQVSAAILESVRTGKTIEIG